MKTWKYLFANMNLKIWKYLFQYMNYENICCITLIMKKIKCLFAIHELWKYFYLQYMNYENRKISALHEYENIKCLFAVHDYENICVQCKNYENVHYETHELWK